MLRCKMNPIQILHTIVSIEPNHILDCLISNHQENIISALLFSVFMFGNFFSGVSLGVYLVYICFKYMLEILFVRSLRGIMLRWTPIMTPSRMRFSFLGVYFWAACVLWTEGWSAQSFWLLIFSPYGIAASKICGNFVSNACIFSIQCKLLQLHILYVILLEGGDERMELLNFAVDFILKNLSFRFPKALRVLYSGLFCYMVEPTRGPVCETKCDVDTGVCGDNPTAKQKKRKPNSASVGAHKPAPDLRSNRKRLHEELTSGYGDAPFRDLTAADLLVDLEKMKQCRCKHGKQHSGGCLLAANGDVNQVLEAVKSCREILRRQSGILWESTFGELFRGTIVEEQRNAAGVVTKIAHCFKICVGGTNVNVCRRVWAIAHGVNSYQLDAYSKAYRKSLQGTIHICRYAW